MELRILNSTQLEQVYHQHMLEDFPKAERKSLATLQKHHRAGHYLCYGLYEDSSPQAPLLGYALLVCRPESAYLLLDYLAVVPERRDSGCGTAFLKLLQGACAAYRGILLEAEDPAAAADAQDAAIRQRRMAFYRRAGTRLMKLRCRLYGVDYRILCLPIAEEEQPDEETVKAALQGFYRLFSPPMLYRRFVRLTLPEEGC